MENQWKRIWNSRKLKPGILETEDKKRIFLELKRINGFDVEKGGIPFVDLWKQYVITKKALCLEEGDSLFEVGCGAGANLYLFSEDGIRIGGLDYADTLIGILQQVFYKGELIECICDEACKLPVDQKYDAVLSNSVFSYFYDLHYAEQVLDRMLLKTKRSIGILDVHDLEKKEAFLDYRRMHIKDYERRYQGLPKLFYPKKFWWNFAQRHHLQLKICTSQMEGYWNTPFVYHCFFCKRN